ncbi:LuxR C-terminal-related transcriptional regulator [Streptomyces sp. NPDC007903]|uniref:helix-turn-helix transcriptional regulator n=1 Tax=Streptomyces sp. NPDC007903 TaxID=3364786 RepID=UPI0036F11AA3
MTIVPGEVLDPRALLAFREKLADAPDRLDTRTMRILLAEIDRLNAEIDRLSVQQLHADSHPAEDCPLTPRQVEILALTASGLSCKETAKRIGVRHQTVQKHRCLINARLGVHTSAASVSICLLRGWLSPADLRLPEPPKKGAPPSLRGATFPERAASLRDRPGEWDTVGVYGTAQSARQGASRIRRGHFAPFRPAGHWEARSLTDNSAHIVRARYIGPPAHTERTAS